MESTHKLAALLKSLLQMFLLELDHYLQNSYFNHFFLMHAKQQLVKYSPGGVLLTLTGGIKCYTYLNKPQSLS